MPDSKELSGHSGLETVVRHPAHHDPDDDPRPSKFKVHVITNDPEFDPKTELAGTSLLSKARIFRKQRIVSYWDDWNPGLVNPTVEFMKRVGQDPEHYVFEFSGRTIKHRSEGHNFQEFLSGEKKKPETEEERNARLEAELNAKRLREAQALLKGGFYNKSYGGD